MGMARKYTFGANHLEVSKVTNEPLNSNALVMFETRNGSASTSVKLTVEEVEDMMEFLTRLRNASMPTTQYLISE